MSFNNERREVDGKRVEILYPLHEIDSFNGEELRNHIVAICDGVDAIVIDFTNIAYLNSSGLRELIQILKCAREKSKSLVLCSLTDNITKIFVHTNLDRLFIFATCLEDAFVVINE